MIKGDFMEKFTLTKNVLKVWRCLVSVVTAGVSIALYVILYIFSLSAMVPLLIILALYLGVIFFYLPRYWKTTYIMISNDAVFCAKGILMRREFVLPRPRLIVVERVRIPFYTYFGLCTIVLRGVGCNLMLPPLETKTSAKLVKLLENGVTNQ